MKKQRAFLIFFMELVLTPFQFYAQEPTPQINVEESAEVFLEAYSDEFQESFFEALKQKGIENYDKAVNHLLACKNLDAENYTVDHELAKTYFLDKQYNLALDYGIVALNSEPENKWYLNTVVEILRKQNQSLALIEDRIPFKNEKLRTHLATIYFERKDFEEALSVVDNLKKSPISTELEGKIKSAIKARDERLKIVSNVIAENDKVDPLKNYKVLLQEMIANNDFEKLLKTSEEAIEEYPSQPYFYFAHGYALNKSLKHKEAVNFLEAALDILIDDPQLGNKIYGTLGEAYQQLNEPEKANKYLSKVIPGL